MFKLTARTQALLKRNGKVCLQTGSCLCWSHGKALSPFPHEYSAIPAEEILLFPFHLLLRKLQCWKEPAWMYTDELTISFNFWSIQIQNSLESFNEASLTLHLIDDLKSLLFNVLCQASVRECRRKKDILHSILFVYWIIRDIRFDIQLTLNLTYCTKWCSNIWNRQHRLGIRN